MRVIATARGYDNLKTREEGEEFDMPDGAKGSWFVPLDEPAKPVKAQKVKSDKPAQTMSEAAAQSDDPPLA